MAAVHPQAPQAALDGDGHLYRQIAETIPLMVWTAQADGAVNFVNRKVLEYTGIDAQAFAGTGWKSIVHPDDLEQCLATWTRAVKSGERCENEMRLRRADGKYRWHHGTGIPVRNAQGALVRWFGTCTDIEDQVRSAQILEQMVGERTRALRESERRFQQFMDHVPAMAWIRDVDFRYRYVNRAFAQFFGKDEAEIIGRDGAEFATPESVAQIRETDRKVLAQGEPMQYVDDLPAGHWLKVKFPLVDAAGKRSVAGVAIDVSARAAAEATVRRLLNRLVGTQEVERRRIADNLHDLIGQNLTALGIELGALKSGLPAQSLPLAQPRLEAMAGLLNDTIESIRGVMTELRPPGLEEFGLVPAVHAHAAEFGKRTGLKVASNVAGLKVRLPADAELAIFRILQEALTNAAKHSGCSSVEIALTEFEGGIRLSVHDDGRGFQDHVGARSAQRGGWGLPAMRERAEANGGDLRIEFPGRGTRLVVEIPGPRGD